MPILRLLLIAALASMTLSACSTGMEGERISVAGLSDADKAQGGEKIDITNPNVTAAKEGIQAEPLAPEGPKGFAAAAQALSNGSVQVFPLDGSKMSQAFKAETRNFRSPSVQVFPLDQAMADDLNLGNSAGGKPLQLAHEDIDGPLTPMPAEGGSIEHAPKISRDGSATVYFDYGSSKLNGPATATVEAVAWNAAGHKGMPIAVNGYASTKAAVTDPIRRKMINLKLSMDRAFAVAKALIDRGVAPELIRTTGWGEVKPAAPTNGMDEEAASRRVEISRVNQ